jgi:hypothetical protein
MTLVTFQPTRFGNWVVKLSFNQDDQLFLVVAYNVMNDSTAIRSFHGEMDVIKFVNFLGEKYE